MSRNIAVGILEDLEELGGGCIGYNVKNPECVKDAFKELSLLV